ncbi:MAG: response regulator [Bdellovibrionaceae bacterium]|nr:response regulator [Bdellovibrionales bacterium]MCB9083235.1 response regulator [Pseudobdellovibrionaceae bacterium]
MSVETKRILIVDDSEIFRLLLKKILKKNPEFVVIEAASGEECLHEVDEYRPDMILLDFMMPTMTGTEALQKLRGSHNAIDLPIIMVTSKTEPKDIVKCLELGANDYITKPVNPEVLLTRMNTHLSLGKLSREMARLNELEIMQTLVTTYNHEVNNPLAIATSCLEFVKAQHSSEDLDKLEESLWRISEIVKKIEKATLGGQVQYEDYSENSKTLKVK